MGVEKRMEQREGKGSGRMERKKIQLTKLQYTNTLADTINHREYLLTSSFSGQCKPTGKAEPLEKIHNKETPRLW